MSNDKDAKIAELTACIVKLQDSLVAAKKREMAAPDSSEMTECRHCGFYVALNRAPADATPAQPAADVSAPTDERTRFENAMRHDGMSEFDIRTDEDGNYRGHEAATLWRGWQFARAAAPVSGPTPEGIEVTVGNMKVYITNGTVQESAALAGLIFKSAAPVSGQGDEPPCDCWVCNGTKRGDPKVIELPPLPPLPEDSYQLVQGRRTVYDAEHMAEYAKRYGRLCIDSRPRSEDSRAKVLEEARTDRGA